MADKNKGNDSEENPATAAPDAEQKGEQKKLVGYIIMPDAMAELVEQCENIPGRYYKRMQPLLTSAQPMFEHEDGTFSTG